MQIAHIYKQHRVAACQLVKNDFRGINYSGSNGFEQIHIYWIQRLLYLDIEIKKYFTNLSVKTTRQSLYFNGVAMRITAQNVKENKIVGF
jgi:hypothetical protein